MKIGKKDDHQEELSSSLPTEDELDQAIEFTFPASDPVVWATPCKRKEKS